MIGLIVGITVGVVGALTGIGTGIKAGIDNKNANDINDLAQTILNNAKKRIEISKAASGKSLEVLGEKKIYILDNKINEFIRLFEKIKNISLNESSGLNELSKFRIDKDNSFLELKELGNLGTSMAKGLASGAVAGALTAFGAYGAATTFATASTGTAIASLSGAAATNATLAFFGGGSLAAGGLGVAGGTAVLGGMVAGPALAILGIVMSAKASKKLDEAYSNKAEAQKIAAELNTAIIMCNGIRRRAYLFQRLLIKCESLFSPLLYEMKKIQVISGVDYNKYTIEQKQTISRALSLAGTIKAILDTPILTEEGVLTPESETIGIEVNKELIIK